MRALSNHRKSAPHRRLGLKSGLSALALLLGSALPATASDVAYDKVALIIGNSDYTVFPDLPNAINDAAAVSQMLNAAGYLVFEKTNLTKQQFSASIAEISANLNASSEVVFFFAGHGFQIGSENYLIPTNSSISDLGDVPLGSISLTHVLEHISTQSGSQIVLLDSCRSNPFAGQTARSGLGSETLRIENGFSFQAAPVNSLISFSTAPGAVALDGEGQNSPYTASLVQATAQFPGHDVASVLPIVRAQVFEDTDGVQVPWESSSLLKPVYLSVRPDPVAPVAVAVAGSERDTDPQPVVRNSAGQGPVAITVTGDVHRHVTLFPPERMAELGAHTALAVAALPERGTLGLRTGTRLRRVQLGERLGREALARLSYSPDIVPVRASEISPQLSDRIALQAGDARVEVALDLRYNACDLAAASPLDPQGLGLSVENFEVVPDVALAACTRAVAADPEVARYHYQLFRAQTANRQLQAAQDSVRKAFELGHTRAHVGLGQVKLVQHNGVDAARERAAPQEIVAHYLDGHKAGDPMATYLLGRQLIRYGETDEDRRRGFALLHRSKDAGYVEALNELGRYFLLTEDGNADPQRGLAYLEASGARGNNHGFNSLGVVFKTGVGGIAPDFERAVASFRAAARLGHPTAPTSLGRVYAEGRLTPPDFVQALSWHDEGLSRGDPWGGVNGAMLILLGKVPGVDASHAAMRAAKVAALDTPEARAAAMDQLEGLSKRDLARGLQALLNEMGQRVTVDGVAGRQTAAAIIEVYGALVPLETKAELRSALVKVAGAYWRDADVRVDLN